MAQKFKIKLSTQQGESISKMLLKAINDTPQNIAESLVNDLLKKFYLRLRSKLESFGKNCNLSVPPEEAKAFYVYFQEAFFSDSEIYERVNIERILGDIDKKYT